jgi:hypothetical protein
MQKQSEVLRLKRQIDLEAEASFRGMYGVSSGTSKHAFISARMEHMGILHQRLAHFIGTNDATRYLIQAMDRKYQPSPKDR